MYYGTIKNCDIANGTGVRVTLFVSGCRNRCKNCFQPQTWDFNYGEPFTEETENHILKLLEPNYITGLTILGGEPFEPENQRELLPFLKHVKSEYPNKTIWCFSGFTFEEMHTVGNRSCTEITDELLSYIDILVDGRFIEEQRDISLRFRGSRNQRIIDLKSTLKNKSITLWQEPNKNFD